MRKICFVALAFLGLALTMAAPISSAHAQLQIRTAPKVDPITGLGQDDFITVATHLINAKPIIGKDSVYMINATGEELQSVTCRGYQLVGPKPYITKNETSNAPAFLPAWSVSLVPSEGFNDYCKAGVDAGGLLASYHGMLNAADKTFASSSFVIFKDSTK